MQLTKTLCLLISFVGCTTMMGKIQKGRDIFICYGKIDPRSVQGYNLVVLESQHYSPSDISIFKLHNNKVLGYISLTEVNETSFYYEEMEGYIFGKNEQWNSSYIDIANPKVQDILFNAIRKITAKGIDGLLLDNIDNTSQWGQLTSSKTDLVNFIKELRKRDKKSYLVQNSGLFLGTELNEYTDAILVESVVTNYDFKLKEYALRDKKTMSEIIFEINRAVKKLRKPIMIVEYVGENKMKKEVEHQLNRLGFSYFIANISLQAEPIFRNDH
ncbi:endo alpha-1,4 polygalactosaminidase [Arenibacter palladensis]|uniref:endo alpha-1,4 polygalactosaminidase n=1 Tax=Arenibacter palladensis TaxID=237373 RepID=UPI0026E29012|nr:endo alpha-1,4 polygalactosaminidase [Arenibacter palladensis]MDO6604154.1 endo alpha-1,4 polygalactosaminidase [Arenibacter palladensis]